MSRGVSFTVEVESRPVLAALQRVLSAGQDASEPLREIGQDFVERVQLGFIDSESPYGVPWEPISHRDGQPLIDTGRLRGSIAYETTPLSLRLGSNVVYAATHQFGRDPIKARPFLPMEGLPPDWERSALDVLTAYLASATEGRA
jgi:phage gpG-like protein